MAFFQRPISASLGALVLLIVLYPLISKLWLKRRAASALQSAQGGH